MLGAISGRPACAGMLLPLTEFVVAHGSLELPAIWISGGAGLMMAQAMLFPGRYSRRAELRLNGRKSVQIIVGIVPLLLVAGAIEGFYSPRRHLGVVKALLGSSLAVAPPRLYLRRATGNKPPRIAFVRWAITSQVPAEPQLVAVDLPLSRGRALKAGRG